MSPQLEAIFSSEFAINPWENFDVDWTKPPRFDVYPDEDISGSVEATVVDLLSGEDDSATVENLRHHRMPMIVQDGRLVSTSSIVSSHFSAFCPFQVTSMEFKFPSVLGDFTLLEQCSFIIVAARND
ncbi:OLC1v1023181C1 [Oldenlandia corymbosa var. corymbosa]|uniref:OLC1v1023181C1 n=1 Tax=Oldenlandia corymbosa var. corymbosa TaxID=529605 RepID=A0AAV1BZE0_OLDCO|nr:OLC1v1023181C1 [Oldenlandia corymbosa var. corymbosa]